MVTYPATLIHSHAMLELHDLSLYRGPRLLFAGADLAIHAGQKVGLTGANGTGKSSLFALIRGELHADAGEITLPPHWTIAHVAQETPAEDTPAVDYVMAGDAELQQLTAELHAAEAAEDGTRQATLHARLEAIDGYTARSRAARLMHGLGFKPTQETTAVRAFSGGWRMRLNLAQALMCRSDLLLLDEPTNHLDLDAVIWLEEWLRSYPGTLMLISHDRDFLDNIATHIVHIEHQTLRRYTGNYTAFEQRRAEQLAGQQAAYEKQQRDIAHIQRFVDRFRAKATKARQAQSRLKALERISLIAPAHVDTPFHFNFPSPAQLPNPLLQLENAHIGYEKTPVLQEVNLSLQPGDRIGLLGANGEGKSTLIKCLASDLTPIGGQRLNAKGMQCGYFAQHQLEQLHAELSPLQHLMALDPHATDQQLRDFIGGFGFNGDTALSPVAPFSGGEKARLVLALLVYRKPNLLLLDEPTNHLDLEMRHALTLALQEYDGAMVVVSHDRHLLRAVCDRFILVADGRAIPFDGDLEDYRRWLSQRNATSQRPDDGEPPARHSAEARKSRRRDDAERRQRLRPLKKEVERWDAKLDQLQIQHSELEQQLADPALYSDDQKDRLKTLLTQQAEIAKHLQHAEEQWLTASEALERAEQTSE